MSTVYDYDLHDLGQGAFQSFQRQALLEQSLRDDVTAPTVASVASSAPEKRRAGGLMRKVVIGAAVTGLVGGVLYIGSRVLSSPGRKN